MAIDSDQWDELVAQVDDHGPAKTVIYFEDLEKDTILVCEITDVQFADDEVKVTVTPQ